MKEYTIAVVVLACCIDACSRRPDPPKPSAPATSAGQGARLGRITMPADSPKLQEIRVEYVQIRNIAVDEVIAPGKIDVNPNRVARVTIPVTGKVVSMRAADSGNIR
jgi:membrane fusion protein, heavy metal efflux system